MGWTIMLKTLRRNGFMPALVVAQVVFALVVLVNIGSFLNQQMAPLWATTGVPAGQVLITRAVYAGDAGLPKWSYAMIQAAEQVLRAMPGVRAVSAGIGAPFMADGLSMAMRPTAIHSHRSFKADMFSGDHVVAALGLHVVKGRGFAATDAVRGSLKAVFSQTHATLLSESLAHRLFPHGDAVGQSIWISEKPDPSDVPLHVVGIVNDTMRSNVQHSAPERVHDVMLVPYQIDGFSQVAFTVRTDPKQRDTVMKRLPKVLAGALGIAKPDSIKVRDYESLRDHALHGNKVAALLLGVVLLTVAVVVVLGITGLSGFWVQKRTRDIGIRRALGAQRGDILRQYHLENLLVVSVGAVLGIALGLLVSVWLREHFELHAPPMRAWIIGAVLMLGFGQLAVLGPALRASRVPPAVATRAV